MNFKDKLTAAVKHVKSHPVPYAIAASSTVTLAIALYLEKNHLDDKQIISLVDNAAKMRSTGKGVYFDLKDGGTVAMLLEEFLDEPLDRLS